MLNIIQQIVVGKIGPDEIDNEIISALKNEIVGSDFGPTVFLTLENSSLEMWDFDGYFFAPNIVRWREDSPLDFNYFTKYKLGRDYYLYVRKGIDIQASL